MIRLVVLALLAGPVASQPRAGEPAAETRFHDGARLYAEGDVEAAVRAVDAGLAEAPADARLRALRELLRQQQEPSDGGGGQQPDDPQDGDDPSESPPDEGQGDNEAPPNPGDSPEQTPPQDGGTGGTSPPADGAGTPPGDASDATRAPMSRAEAEALLDAVGGDERLLLRRQRLRGGGVVRPERDW